MLASPIHKTPKAMKLVTLLPPCKFINFSFRLTFKFINFFLISFLEYCWLLFLLMHIAVVVWRPSTVSVQFSLHWWRFLCWKDCSLYYTINFRRYSSSSVDVEISQNRLWKSSLNFEKKMLCHHRNEFIPCEGVMLLVLWTCQFRTLLETSLFPVWLHKNKDNFMYTL